MIESLIIVIGVIIVVVIVVVTIFYLFTGIYFFTHTKRIKINLFFQSPGERDRRGERDPS
jgi:hypothetical protein